MICRLCKKEEPYSLRFGDYGSTLFWCRSCVRKYREKPLTILLPLGGGNLRIESCYAHPTLDDAILEGLWMKADKLLKTALSQPSNATVVLWFDAVVEYTAPIWLKLLEGMGDLFVLSLFELDPLSWMKDDS